MENEESIAAYILSFILTVTIISTVIFSAVNSKTDIFTSLGTLLQASLILAGVLVAILLIWYVYNLNSIENQSIKLLKRYSREGFSEIQLIESNVPGNNYFILKSEKLEKKVSISRTGRIIEYPETN